MALSREKKLDVVSQVSDLLSNSKMTVFAKYSGTSVKAMQNLRSQSKANGTIVRIVKNRLFKQALKSNQKYQNIDLDFLKGQLLYAFNSLDEVAPAQSLDAFAKKEPQIEFIGALMADGSFLDAQEVKTLAKLPNKPQLIAEAVALLISPVNDITNGLGGNLPELLEALASHNALI